jgi:hypothetical protein
VTAPTKQVKDFVPAGSESTGDALAAEAVVSFRAEALSDPALALNVVGDLAQIAALLARSAAKACDRLAAAGYNIDPVTSPDCSVAGPVG